MISRGGSGDLRDTSHHLVRRVLIICTAIASAACSRDRGSAPISAESIALTTSATSSIGVGQSVTIYAHASDANGTRIPHFTAITWTSSNPTVASVTKDDSTATVTGIAVGETIISATVRSNLVAQLPIRVGAVPVIVATPPTVVFTGYRTSPIAPQMIVISNAGAGSLTSLSATSAAPWLQATFVSGQAIADPTATLRLQPSIGALADGSYSTTVTVSSSMSGVAPRSIPVTFQLSAAPVAFKMEALTSPSQGGSAGKPVSQPPAVVVLAADNTPVPGVPVTFVVSGGGAIAPTGVIMSNANGVAALTSWTLGPQAGVSQTVTASSPGLAGSPITFSATSLAASKIVKVSGDAQSTVLGRPLPQPIVVRVTDPNDALVPNATVTFTVNGGGSLSATGATTDASGQASVRWTLGATLGTQTLTASLVGPQGAPFVTFTATATGATDIAKVSGDNQQGAAGSDLTAPLRVRVTGANSEPVVGVLVTFSPNGGGVATPPTATTDANGEATTRWTLPPTTGSKTLTASISSATGPASVTFGALATAPPPSGIVIVDGDNQSGQAGSALPRQIVARVVTTIGSGIPGATVTFTPASGSGQSFSPASGVTDANGEVRTTWTLGSALGSYTATVASAGLPSRTITATASQLAPNVGIFTGGAARVPSGAAPGPAEQAVLAYSGPASGEVALGAGGSFTTPVLPAGTYTLSIVSKSGAFPTTSVYGVSLPGGQITSVGTISVAYSGVGTVRIAVHACSVVGDANGTATVRLYLGVNGDQAGGPAYTSTIPFGNVNTLVVNYGIYTMTITTTNNVDPTKTCAVYRASLVHSWTIPNGDTSLPLIVLSN